MMFFETGHYGCTNWVVVSAGIEDGKCSDYCPGYQFGEIPDMRRCWYVLRGLAAYWLRATQRESARVRQSLDFRFRPSIDLYL